MTEEQPPASPAASDHSQRDRILGPKSWTAIIAVTFVLGIVLWVVVSVLTARPSVDPTVHTDAVALSNSQQPDPDEPSRYAEFVHALEQFQESMSAIADEVVSDDHILYGRKLLYFQSLQHTPDPNDREKRWTEVERRDATRAVEIIVDRELFRSVERILTAKNLANPYTKAHDPAGRPLPVYKWNDEVYSYAREYAFTVAGCARVLADRGRIDEASDLIVRNVDISDVFLRQTTFVEHWYGGYQIARINANAIEYLIAHPNLTQRDLRQLQTAQTKMSGFRPLKHLVGGQLLEIRDTLYRTHTESGRYIHSVGVELTRSNLTGSKVNLIERFLQDAQSRFSSPLREASLDFLERQLDLANKADSGPDIATRRSILLQIQTNYDTLGSDYEILHNTKHLVTEIIRGELAHRARITALGILLTMAEYRLDHGDWPTTLDQLVPDYLDAIPTNPVTGDPFEYDHEPGQPPSLERLGVDWDRR